MDEKVLALRPNYHPLFTSEHGKIVGTAPGGMFAKGIRVKTENTLFSYDFSDVETNRDRNSFVNFSLYERVRGIWAELDNKRLIKHLLQRSIVTPDGNNTFTIENDGYGNITSKYPSLWKKAFEECFGESACLDTGYKFPSVFDGSHIRRIRFPDGIKKQLQLAGVKTDLEAVPDFHSETLPTSLTLAYGGNIWSASRIFLDTVQNHLPRDSGGNWVTIKFKTTAGEWHDYKELSGFKDDQIDAVRVADNGRGFAYPLLGIFGSTKDGGDSSGKFGEGLKMISAAAVKAGMQVIIRSRDWMATPTTEGVEIDGKKFDRLVFQITRELKKGVFARTKFGGLLRYEESATIFVQPSAALLEEFRNAHKNVLAIEDPEPLVKTHAGNIMSLTGGKLYIRDILIPGAHDLQYSYHLPNFDIQSRDRDHVSANDLRPVLANIWSGTKEPEVIKDYLLQATHAATTGRVRLDFDVAFTPQNQAVWVSVFKETFGEAAAYRDVASEEFNEVHENQHLGLTTVTMPTAVCKTLARCRDENGEGIISYQVSLHEANKIEIIPDEALTQRERDELQFLREKICPIIVPDKQPVQVVAFEPRGKIAAAGLSGNPVKINRTTLEERAFATNVFIHETAHNETGASDADKAFRDFLSMSCARLAIAMADNGEEKPTPPATATPGIPLAQNTAN
jgi:hypothetical protein